MTAPIRRGRGKSAKTLRLVELARAIAEECQPITGRGIAYKLFTMGEIASMHTNEVRKVYAANGWARDHGIIPWEWIVDETREAESIPTWASPDERIASAIRNYRRDYWESQPLDVEVWSEKGTVRGVLRPILDRFGLTFRVLHGFGDKGTMHATAERSIQSLKPCVVLYVGDWDPSGLYMSEADAPGRIAKYGGRVHFERIALTAPDLPDLPSFDAATKGKDPRYRWFVERYGHQCWELDAMSPVDLRARVERQVVELIDIPAWNHLVHVEDAERESMERFHASWRASISVPDQKYSEEGAR